MDQYKEIVDELQNYKKLVSFYTTRFLSSSRYAKDNSQELLNAREEITKNSAKIKKYLKDAGVQTAMVGRAAPVAGGFQFHYDLIDDIFHNEGTPYAVRPQMIIDTLNKAIGIYESGDLPIKILEKPKKVDDHSVLTEDRIKNLNLKQLLSALSLGTWIWILALIGGIFFSGMKFQEIVIPVIKGQ